MTTTTAPRFNDQIADTIRWLIHREDMPQNWLGVASGLGPDELSRRMTGKVPFDLDDLADVAHALRMEPLDLVRMAGDLMEDGDL